MAGKKRSKAPKIQRLVTPVTLQRKRRRIALKKKRIVKSKNEAAEYQKLSEIYQKLAPSFSKCLIKHILWTFHHSEGLSKHLQTFLNTLLSLEPYALTFLLLKPLLYDHVHEFNYLKYFAPNLFGLYYSIRCLSIVFKLWLPSLLVLEWIQQRHHLPTYTTMKVIIIGHRRWWC